MPLASIKAMCRGDCILRLLTSFECCSHFYDTGSVAGKVLVFGGIGVASLLFYLILAGHGQSPYFVLNSTIVITSIVLVLVHLFGKFEIVRGSPFWVLSFVR